jgi:peptidoglycan-associated lipoprotein
MKMIKFANLLVFGLVLTTIVPGCRKRPEDVTNIPGSRTENPKVPGSDLDNPKIVDNTFPSSTNLNGQPYPLTDPTNHMFWARDTEVFKSDTVHFAFDSSVVRNDQKPHVAAVAAYLKSNPAKAVEVEGHCDERGTAEYNRALGERRALAIRELLIGLGIEPSRVDTITYGYDRPVEPGHTAAAWEKNRRGEFILLTPPARTVE